MQHKLPQLCGGLEADLGFPRAQTLSTITNFTRHVGGAGGRCPTRRLSPPALLQDVSLCPSKLQRWQKTAAEAPSPAPDRCSLTSFVKHGCPSSPVTQRWGGACASPGVSQVGGRGQRHSDPAAAGAVTSQMGSPAFRRVLRPLGSLAWDVFPSTRQGQRFQTRALEAGFPRRASLPPPHGT